MTTTREPREVSPELRRAYEEAEYVVDVLGDGGMLMVLKVGQLHPQLDLLLEDRESAPRSWCFITAWNPRSQRRADGENLAAQERLRRRLRMLGLDSLPGWGRDPHSDWEEESLFVMGVTRSTALRLAGEFEQSAVLYGEVGGPAQLLFS